MFLLTLKLSILAKISMILGLDRFGFVSFANKEDATKAIDNLDGIKLKGRRIRVKKAERNRKLRIGERIRRDVHFVKLEEFVSLENRWN